MMLFWAIGEELRHCGGCYGSESQGSDNQLVRLGEPLTEGTGQSIWNLPLVRPILFASHLMISIIVTDIQRLLPVQLNGVQTQNSSPPPPPPPRSSPLLLPRLRLTQLKASASLCAQASGKSLDDYKKGGGGVSPFVLSRPRFKALLHYLLLTRVFH